MLRKPSPALVVACLALLAALAGTGVASVKISQRPSAAGVIHVHPVFVPGTSRGGAIANCPAGTRATGGGAYLEGTPSNDDHIVDSEPAVPDKLSLAAAREAVQGCRGCDLYRNATQAVFGEGRKDSRVQPEVRAPRDPRVIPVQPGRRVPLGRRAIPPQVFRSLGQCSDRAGTWALMVRDWQ